MSNCHVSSFFHEKTLELRGIGDSCRKSVYFAWNIRRYFAIVLPRFPQSYGQSYPRKATPAKNRERIGASERIALRIVTDSLRFCWLIHPPSNIFSLESDTYRNSSAEYRWLPTHWGGSSAKYDSALSRTKDGGSGARPKESVFWRLAGRLLSCHYCIKFQKCWRRVEIFWKEGREEGR